MLWRGHAECVRVYLTVKDKCPPNASWRNIIYCVIRPTYPEEELDEENIIEDDSELNLNKVEEEMMMEV